MQTIGQHLGIATATTSGPYRRRSKTYKPSLDLSQATDAQKLKSEIARLAQLSRPRQSTFGFIMPSWELGKFFNLPDALKKAKRLFPDITSAELAVLDSLGAIELANAAQKKGRKLTTGRCRPRLRAIVAAVRRRTAGMVTMCRRTAQYALKRLEARGMVIISRFGRKGRQTTNRYYALHWLEWIVAAAKDHAVFEQGYQPPQLPELGTLDLTADDHDGLLDLVSGGATAAPPRTLMEKTTIPPAAQIPHVTDKTDAETAAPSLKNLSGAALARAELAAALSRRRE